MYTNENNDERKHHNSEESEGVLELKERLLHSRLPDQIDDGYMDAFLIESIMEHPRETHELLEIRDME